MDLTDEQDDLIYEIEREFPVTFKGDWKGGRFVADRNAVMTRELVEDIFDLCHAYGFSVSVYDYDEVEVNFDFDNYHGEARGINYV